MLDHVPELSAVTSEEFPQQAERPKYSVLDVSATQSIYGVGRPGLEASVRACIEDLVNGND